MLLIIDNNNYLGNIFSNMLHLIGVLAEATPHPSQASQRSFVYSAVLIINPTPRNIGDVLTLSKESFHVPHFALITEGELPLNLEREFDKCFFGEVSCSRLLEGIRSYQKSCGFKALGDYELNELRASALEGGVYYNGKIISFTKTEAMILRCLISHHPFGLYAKTLLNLAFKSTKQPELSNVRTHISLMNKKFLYLTGKRIISLNENGQYYIAI